MNNKRREDNRVLYYADKLKKKIYYGVPQYIHYVYSLHYMKRNRKIINKKISNREILNVVFIIQYIP